MNSGKQDKNKIESSKKILEELIIEYNNIKKEAKDKYEYYDKLLIQFEKDYSKNNETNGVDVIFKKISKDIMDNAINNFIKCEKAIIVIIEKFNSINF